MYPRIITTLMLVLATTACDKVKNYTTKASTAVREKISGKAGPGESTKVDADLQKLVDQTAEGTIFRKDLPFPTQLEVRTTRRLEISARFVQSSAFGKEAVTSKGTQKVLTKLERRGNQIRYTVERSSFTLPVAAKSQGAKPAAEEPVEQVAPASPPVIFRKTGKTWGAEDRSDFHAMALAQQIAPKFEQLLIEYAVAPRPLWFAKQRLKVGEQVVIAGDTLPMLTGAVAKGSCTLKLGSFEAVDGHPCGVFAITGDYSRKQFPDFEGKLSDEDVTIQTGKIWCSLIYPVILKQELDTIQSGSSGGQGGVVTRSQGTIKVSVTHAWKRLEP